MGIFGNGSKPGAGSGCSKCDYCGTRLNSDESNRLPHIGSSPLMTHNRYFCSPGCLRNWRDQYQYNGD